jgi:hypothetical protein
MSFWWNRREEVWDEYKTDLWGRLTLKAVVVIGNVTYEKDFDWHEHCHDSLFNSFFPRRYRDTIAVTEGVSREEYEAWAHRIIIE